jgi:hypothetical protein
MNRALVSLLWILVVVAGGAIAHEIRPKVWNVLNLPKSSTPIARWMKANGWETQRGDPKRFRVGSAGLEMVSRDDSVAIGLKRGFPIDPNHWRRVRFTFRIDRLPIGTNLKKKPGDDAAFRLYVAFDRDDGWFHPPHTIAYAWTENTAPETIVQSAHFTQLRYLSIGCGAGRDKTGAPRWITIERDLLTDYRRAFPKADARVPAIVGLLLKCDSNNTDTRAAATVKRVQLIERRG